MDSLAVRKLIFKQFQVYLRSVELNIEKFSVCACENCGKAIDRHIQNDSHTHTHTQEKAI